MKLIPLALSTLALCLASTVAAEEEPTPVTPDALQLFKAYQAMPATPGTGPYPATVTVDPGLAFHVIYRPKDLDAMGGKKLGVVIWGNGGCAQDAGMARFHTTELASHGYIVIAPGELQTGPGAKMTVDEMFAIKDRVSPQDMIAGLDWILAENARPGSPYYGRIDPKMVAVSGHSCGAAESVIVAADPRIHAVVLHNGGIWTVFPDFAVHDKSTPLINVGKGAVKRIHTPVLSIMGGPTDIAYDVAKEDFALIEGQPAALVEGPTGHDGTFFDQNGGRGAEIAVAWLEWRLRGDKKAARLFEGPECGLCNDPRWTIQKKGFR